MKSDTWKTQLTIEITYKRARHSKYDNIEIITYELLLKRYNINLKTPKKGSDFIFHCANLLYYKWHKINLNCGDRSYIDFSNWT